MSITIEEVRHLMTTFHTVLDILERSIESGVSVPSRVQDQVNRIRGLLNRAEKRDEGHLTSTLMGMRKLLAERTTVSSSGLDVTIACDTHGTKDIVLQFMTGSSS